MLITLQGLVIRERTVGENDKFIDLLTTEYGVIEASVRGVRKLTSKHAGAVQMFAYSNFCLDKRGERYYLNSAQPIHIFYDLRLSVERMALAMYFAELVKFTVSSEQDAGNILQLTLAGLHYISAGSRDIALIKAAFELRLMSELGFMPDLTGCSRCANHLHEMMFFSPQEGSLVCGNCYVSSDTLQYFVSPSVLRAMRHIIYVEIERVFSFKLSEDSLKTLSEINEAYAIAHLEKRLKTLDFYHSVIHL